MTKTKKSVSITNNKTKKLKHYTKVEIEYLKLLRIYDKAITDIRIQMDILEKSIFEN